MVSKQTLDRRERMERRIPGPNGRWFHPECPAHGTSVGVAYWGCCCDPCRAWSAETRRRWRANVTHNRMISAQLTEIIPPPTPEPAPTPEPLPPTPEVVPEPPPVEPEPVPDVEQVPAPERKPEPVRERVQLGVVQDMSIPDMLPAAMRRITTRDQLGLVLRAYHTPQWTAPTPTGAERRSWGHIEVVVAEGGLVLGIYQRKRDPEPEQRQPAERGQKKAKGGRGGSRQPTSMPELLSRAKEIGCDWEYTKNGHIRVTTPGGIVIVPSTASDWRSVRNSWSQIQRTMRGKR
jgi:hypothetical protein